MLEQYELSSENDLVTTLNNKVVPFWNEKVSTGYFVSHDNLNIHYAHCIPENAHNTIVICPGRTESYIKYQELTFDLSHLGYAVFIIDHRGQGFSSRLLTNPHIGHVGEFKHYADDFKCFLDDIVVPLAKGKLHLLAHSMGGAISTLLLMNHSEYFDKAALLSPMFGISSGFVPAPLARGLVDIFRDTLLWEANREKYFPGQLDYHDKAFTDNPLTTSEVRFRLIQETNQNYPQTQLGGISFHWLHNAIEAIDHIMTAPPLADVSILLITAGNDRVVDNNSHYLFKERNNCTHIVIEGAEHELLFEKDSLRSAALQAVLQFFAQ